MYYISTAKVCVIQFSTAIKPNPVYYKAAEMDVSAG